MTPDDLKNSNRPSGFKHVRVRDNGKYCGEVRGAQAKRLFYTGNRDTGEEAAQEVCDWLNQHRPPNTISDMSEVETAWLAGLLEGEGYFGASKVGKTKSRNRTLRVSLVMTDKDVVEKAHRLTGVSTRLGFYAPKDRPSWNPSWSVRWAGKDAEDLMRAILPYMGERRAGRIRECLSIENLSHTPS